MNSQPQRSEDIPLDVPSAARMYDYFLGGYHNFEVDRRAADAASAVYPDLPYILRANRAFLRRCVTYLTQHGIDQFLDLGSGIPTVGNVHEVLQDLGSDARVVYVDVDPIAVSQSQDLLQDVPIASVAQADIRQPETVFTNPEVARLLDFERPVGVLCVAILHFLEDEVCGRLIQSVYDAVASGSYLAITHASMEGVGPEKGAELKAIYARTPTPLIFRNRAEIAALFDGFYMPLWWPEGPDDIFIDDPERSSGYAGAGRKP
jgi:hypothetical protein